MKLYVDTNGKQVTVTKDPVAKNDGQTDRQKTERGTGRPMWSTQVFVLDDDGGEVITVTTAGESCVRLWREFAGLAGAVGEFWVHRSADERSGARKPGAVINAADLGAVADGGGVTDPEQVGEGQRVAAGGVGFGQQPVGAQAAGGDARPGGRCPGRIRG